MIIRKKGVPGGFLFFQNNSFIYERCLYICRANQIQMGYKYDYDQALEVLGGHPARISDSTLKQVVLSHFGEGYSFESAIILFPCGIIVKEYDREVNKYMIMLDRSEYGASKWEMLVQRIAEWGEEEFESKTYGIEVLSKYVGIRQERTIAELLFELWKTFPDLDWKDGSSPNDVCDCVYLPGDGLEYRYKIFVPNAKENDYEEEKFADFSIIEEDGESSVYGFKTIRQVMNYLIDELRTREEVGRA